MFLKMSLYKVSDNTTCALILFRQKAGYARLLSGGTGDALRGVLRVHVAAQAGGIHDLSNRQKC
jgi:hypothetical protein